MPLSENEPVEPAALASQNQKQGQPGVGPPTEGSVVFAERESTWFIDRIVAKIWSIATHSGVKNLTARH